MKEITVKELKAKVDAKEDFQLIDVREGFEYEAANMNALHIPLGNILTETDRIATDKPVIIHCRSGHRSAAAILQLEQQGFTNLYNLKGGIIAWAAEVDGSLKVQ